jgi:NAD(P)-dependent dehydrogenase (short-subunit alcohol dehydrogenase family)
VTIPSLSADGKVVVVTGASKGLGRAMALGFAEAGADLVVASRKLERCQQVADEVATLGRQALAVRCHVGDWDQCAELVDRAVARFGRIDVLVNNAGIATHRETEDISLDYWRAALDINITAPFRHSRP